MTGYLQQNNLLPEFQSAYRHHHSTESTVLKMFSDIVDALDRGNLVLLSLLDLSAAFDTVDHDILRQRLTRSFGIRAKSLHWLDLYLIGRTQSVYLDGTSTTPRNILWGPARFRARTAVIHALHGRHQPHHSSSQSSTPPLRERHAIILLLYTSGKCMS